MSRIDVLRPFIEKNLAAMLEQERVAPDADGEYSFPARQRGGHPAPARRAGAAAPVVGGPRVGLKKKARLLEAVNDVNATEMGVRVFRFEDLLIAAWEVPADTLDPRQFTEICHRFAEIADRLDTVLARKFGGKTARADADDEAVDA